MHNILNTLQWYYYSTSQKLKAAKSVVKAPQNSTAVKILPYLVEIENYAKELGNKVITTGQDFLSTLSELAGDFLKSNNSNSCNDLDNSNPTDINDYNWDLCESLVAQHKAEKEADENLKYHFVAGHIETQKPEYDYDASTASNYLLTITDDGWVYIENNIQH